MIFEIGELTLDKITGGVLNIGIIPWNRLFQTPDEQDNPSGVTVLVTDTELSTTEGKVLAVGEVALCLAKCTFTKGATGGSIRYWIDATAGFGGFVGLGTRAQNDITAVIAAEIVTAHLVGLYRCTVAGTVTFKTVANSVGSNATVGAGDADLQVFLTDT